MSVTNKWPRTREGFVIYLTWSFVQYIYYIRPYINSCTYKYKLMQVLINNYGIQLQYTLLQS